MSEVNYTKAFAELQDIVHEIENGEISVDVLSKKVKVWRCFCTVSIFTSLKKIASVMFPKNAN